MYNTKKLMLMEFSRYMLHKLGGFTTDMFIQIMKELPEGTEIRSLAEIPYKDCYGILLSHDSFKELQEAERFPEVIPIVTKNYAPDGSFTTSVHLEWPATFKASHDCQYKTYQGFSKTEEICTICGKVK